MKWFLFTLSILSSTTSDEFERTIEATRMIQFDNSVVLEYISGSVTGLNSVIKCLRTCANDKICQSFFYRISDGFCQLNTRVFSNDSNWQSSEGTKHYQVRTDWCPVANGYFNSRETDLCYKLHKDTKKWPQARQVCQNEGGDLIVLDTDDKYNHIVDFIRSLKELTLMDIAVGASDVDKEGKWLWVNGKELLINDPIWAKNEPNDGWALTSQDYAIISTLQGLKLDDDELRSLYYLCEIKPQRN